MEISTKATLSRIKRKGMDRCFGVIVAFIKANGERESRMEKGKFIC